MCLHPFSLEKKTPNVPLMQEDLPELVKAVTEVLREQLTSLRCTTQVTGLRAKQEPRETQWVSKAHNGRIIECNKEVRQATNK